MERQPITREGYEKLRTEIKHLEDVEMPKIAEKIAEARSEGDLSENAEYHGQREAQGMLQAKINQLKTKLAGCYVVDKADMPKGVITFGSTVTVKDLDLDDLETSWISDAPNTINTQDTAHTYRVELYSGGEFAARSNRASSLFIELIPNDNQIERTWRE